jgi:hypothetical protein
MFLSLPLGKLVLTRHARSFAPRVTIEFRHSRTPMCVVRCAVCFQYSGDNDSMIRAASFNTLLAEKNPRARSCFLFSHTTTSELVLKNYWEKQHTFEAIAITFHISRFVLPTLYTQESFLFMCLSCFRNCNSKNAHHLSP